MGEQKGGVLSGWGGEDGERGPANVHVLCRKEKGQPLPQTTRRRTPSGQVGRICAAEGAAPFQFAQGA